MNAGDVNYTLSNILMVHLSRSRWCRNYRDSPDENKQHFNQVRL